MSSSPNPAVSAHGGSSGGGGTPTLPTTTYIHNQFNGIFKSKEELIETSTIAGQIGPLLKKFSLSRDQVTAIVEGIKSVAQVGDISLLVVVGWFVVPLMKLWYERLMVDTFPLGVSSTVSDELSETEQQYTGESSSYSPTGTGIRPFEKTKIYHFFNTLAELARLAMLVYVADFIKIFLLGAGFEIPKNKQLTHAFSYVVYTLWIFRRISTFKHYVLSNMIKQSGSDPGRVRVINRFIDAGLFVLAIFALYEILNVKMGIALRGVVAIGSVWTLVVSLALKEIVGNFFHGFILAASDRIYEGDSIRMSKSGFKGTVARLGWFETSLRGSDDILVTIPNSELLGSQVSNLSRIKICQVYQTLRFPYSDVERLPKLTHDIKCEIRSACPSVITDGSRPFRCYWTNFQPDHLEVIIDAHFRIKPVGDAYWDNRQRVLQAIDRAVKYNEMSYHGV